MKLEYNKDSNVGIAPFGYNQRSKLIIIKKNMTLNTKIEKIVNKPFTIDDLEKIADDLAIKFFEWTMDYCVEFYDSTERGSIYKFSNHDNKYTNKELLEMFKKQKGL